MAGFNRKYRKYQIGITERIKYEGEFFDSRIKRDKDKFDLQIPDTYVHGLGKFLLNNLNINVENKVILDCGCGTGRLSVALALIGANVFGIDVSEESIKVTLDRAKLHDVQSRVKAFVMPVEKLDFGDGIFDFVVGEVVLHHVDVESAGKEILRVMKEGGKAIFHENMDRNKILMLFRHMLPKPYRLRDELEYPLRKEEILILKEIFNGNLCIYSHGFHFFQLLDIIFKGRLVLLSRLLNKIDLSLSKVFPFLKRYSYYHLLIMEKKKRLFLKVSG